MKTVRYFLENYDYQSLEIYVNGKLNPFITDKSLNPLVGSTRSVLEKQVENFLFNEDCKYLRLYIQTGVKNNV